MSEIKLNDAQERAFKELKTFTQSPASRVFILTGYAGSGKSTLMNFYVKWLYSRGYINGCMDKNLIRNGIIESEESKVPVFLPLASTGRAAKILRDKIEGSARTVHSWIYQIDDLVGDDDILEAESDGQLLLKFVCSQSVNRPAVYIIDEASMVGDTKDPNPLQAIYGTGRLLTDLLNHDEYGKFVFIGDNYQLPPVKNIDSPALSASYFKTQFGISVASAFLDSIVRQAEGNDIVQAANTIRKLADVPTLSKWAKYPLRGYSNIRLLHGRETLATEYAHKIKRDGYDSAVLIVSSNRARNELSQYIRYQLGYREPRLRAGELLLVVQNNVPTGLMNGDFVKVKSVGARRERANLTFLQIQVENLVSGMIFTTLIIENLLYSNDINLDRIAQTELFKDFIIREADRGVEIYETVNGVKRKTAQFMEDLCNDEYLNALRVVYGYAITCHKSQGGEWDEVYVDLGWRKPIRETYQWMYTAMTRAKKMLYIEDSPMIV